MIHSKSPAVLYLNKLSVMLVSLLLLLFWLNFESTKTRKETYPSQTENTNKNKTNDSKYIKTLTINPFQQSHDKVSSDDSLPTVTTLQSTIPDFSSLQLRLHGIVYQRNQDSYAMISLEGAIQEIYQVNAEISEGLHLTKITKKHVEIDYFGEHHMLTIEQTRLAYKPEIEEIIDLNFKQQIDLLEVDKQRNPIRLFMIRRPYAVYKNGEFQGYKIMPGSNNDQFKRLGFKSGDIITYLNGVEFTGPGYKEFVIQQLTHAMHVDLTVLRDNQELSINYGF